MLESRNRHRAIRRSIACVLVVAVGCFAWNGDHIEKALDAERMVMLDRVLTAAVGAARGQQEGFLIAWSVSEEVRADEDRTLRLPLQIPIGSVHVQATARYAVDLGIDLSSMVSMQLRCDPGPVDCMWIVPAPTARPPSLDLRTLDLHDHSCGVVPPSNLQEARDEIVKILDATMRARIDAPEFWSFARENVRASVAQFARSAFLQAGELAPPLIRVVFRDEIAQEPAS